MSVAFLFPGQGSQHVGMGHELVTHEPAARAVFDLADRQLGFSLSELCFRGPEDALTTTVNQQPALFVTSVAAWQAMQAAGWPAPDYVAGHSLGEFSALVVSGSLSFSDGLSLVRRRGELMQAAGDRQPGAMAAVLGLDVATVDSVCREAQATTNRPVQIANDNCPGQLVISGDKDALAAAVQLAQDAGARRVKSLPITIAAHSTLMATAADEFAALVNETRLVAPERPIIGNVTATSLTTTGQIRAELKAQLTSTVRWTDSMQYLLAQGVDTCVEVGAGDVLSGLMKRIDRRVKRVKFSVNSA